MASKIEKKHYTKYQEKEGCEIDVFDQTIVTACTRHKSLAISLVSSKT